MWLKNFRVIAFWDNFEFKLNFSNFTNYEKFLKKVTIIIKKCLIFSLNFFHSIWFKSSKKLLKMAILTFRVFGNILKIFLISCSKIFKLIFLETLLKLLGMATFTIVKCVLVCFLLLFKLWIVSFEVILRFGRSRSKPYFIQN